MNNNKIYSKRLHKICLKIYLRVKGRLNLKSDVQIQF